MKILIVDHFGQVPDDPGNNRFAYLAARLAQRGHSVELIISGFSHKEKAQRSAISNPSEVPYEITLIAEPSYRGNVSLKRLYSHCRFGKSLERHLATRHADLVYVAVPSLDAGTACVNYCRARAVPLIVDIQDLWPEAFKLVLPRTIVSDIAIQPMARQAASIYANADAIVAVSETYLNHACSRLERRTVPHRVVHLGTDLEDFDRFSTASRWSKPEGQQWITYVGTLGHSYDIELVMRAIAKTDGHLRETLVLKVLGDGPRMQELSSLASRLGIKVDFLGRLHYSEMTGCLAVSDIAVNPIRKGAAQSIINKHADYAAAGLPVVSSQECIEYEQMLTRYQAGISCPAGDVSAMAEAIVAILGDLDLKVQMGKGSRRMAEETFDRRLTYQSIVDMAEGFQE